MSCIDSSQKENWTFRNNTTSCLSCWSDLVTTMGSCAWHKREEKKTAGFILWGQISPIKNTSPFKFILQIWDQHALQRQLTHLEISCTEKPSSCSCGWRSEVCSRSQHLFSHGLFEGIKGMVSLPPDVIPARYSKLSFGYPRAPGSSLLSPRAKQPQGSPSKRLSSIPTWPPEKVSSCGKACGFSTAELWIKLFRSDWQRFSFYSLTFKMMRYNLYLSYRMTEWPGLKGTSRIINLQLPCLMHSHTCCTFLKLTWQEKNIQTISKLSVECDSFPDTSPEVLKLGFAVSGLEKLQSYLSQCSGRRT